MNNTKKAKTVRRSTEEVLSEIMRPARGILFLSRLLKWWPHAKRYEQGKFWIYKSRQDWGTELGIPLKTLEGYITTLRKGGWIETAAIERFITDGHRYGEKILHVRPTEKLMKYVQEGTGKGFDRPKKMGMGAPQNSGGPPLKNEGDPPLNLGDHNKETSSLSKKKHKKKQKSGTGPQTDTFSPVHPVFGKKEDNPSGHPGSSSLPPNPLGATKPGKFVVVQTKEEIANPLEHL